MTTAVPSSTASITRHTFSFSLAYANSIAFLVSRNQALVYVMVTDKKIAWRLVLFIVYEASACLHSNKQSTPRRAIYRTPLVGVDIGKRRRSLTA